MWLSWFVGGFDCAVVVLGDAGPLLLSLCYTEKAPNAWHHRGTQTLCLKDRKHLQSTQSALPTHLTDKAPSTTRRTDRETHNTNYNSSCARFSTTSFLCVTHMHVHLWYACTCACAYAWRYPRASTKCICMCMFMCFPLFFPQHTNHKKPRPGIATEGLHTGFGFG